MGRHRAEAKAVRLLTLRLCRARWQEPQTQPDGRCAGGWVAGAESAEQCLRMSTCAGPGGMQRVSFPPYISPAFSGGGLQFDRSSQFVSGRR